jgi:hypothetical protein
MKDLIGNRVTAIADHGTYKGKQVRGTLHFSEVSEQYLVRTGVKVVSVMKETVEKIG